LGPEGRCGRCTGQVASSSAAGERGIAYFTQNPFVYPQNFVNVDRATRRTVADVVVDGRPRVPLYRQAALADDPRARSRVHARAGRRLARRHSRGYDVDGEAAERVRRLASISTLIPQETEIFEARLRENRTVAAHRASMRDA